MTGRIPKTFISDLLARADIVEVVNGYVPLRKAGRDYQALCPFHEEQTPSFTVSQEKQFYHCFGCGAHGTVISFIMEYNKLGYVEAIEDLAGHYNLEIPREAGYRSERGQHQELSQLLEQAVRFYQEQLQRHQGRATDYLTRRGLSAAIIRDYEIGYAPPGWQNLLKALGKTVDSARMAEVGLIKRRDTGEDIRPSGGRTAGHTGGYYDRFRNRIMFPIRAQRGHVIGFGGRALDAENKPKYLNSPETPLFHKGRELYGLFQARRQKKTPESLYVVEGYMDVIALAQHGIDNVVATLGTAVTEDHLEKLFRTAGRLIFCFDGDAAGRVAAGRALEVTSSRLREGRQVFFKFMPQGDDPDSFIRQYGTERFRAEENTVPFSDFLLASIKSDTGVATREERGDFLDRIVSFLKKMPPSGLHQLLLQEVAQITHTTTDELRRQLQDKRSGTARQASVSHTRQRQERTEQISALIRYLLHSPSLAMKVADPAELSGISIPGIDFLQEFLGLVHSNPEITCAGLLEHYRGSRYEARLQALAAGSATLVDKEFDVEREFIDRIERLKAIQARQSMEAKIASKSFEELKPQLRQRYPQANKDS